MLQRLQIEADRSSSPGEDIRSGDITAEGDGTGDLRARAGSWRNRRASSPAWR